MSGIICRKLTENISYNKIFQPTESIFQQNIPTGRTGKSVKTKKSLNDNIL